MEEPFIRRRAVTTFERGVSNRLKQFADLPAFVQVRSVQNPAQIRGHSLVRLDYFLTFAQQMRNQPP
jgi:hypothetical protein